MVGAAPGAQAKTGKNRIHAVSAKVHDGATEIRIRGTETPRFTVFRLDSPPRVVVDVAGATLAKRIAREDASKASWQVSTWAVGEVAAAEIESHGGKAVRVSVELARPGIYKVAADGKDVVVRIIAATPRPTQGMSAAQAKAMRARAAKESQAADSARAEANRARAEAKALRAAVKKAKLAAAEAKKLAANHASEAEAARETARKAAEDAQSRVAAANERQKRAEAAARKARKAAESWRRKAERAKARKAAEATAIRARAKAAAREASERDRQARAAAKLAEAHKSEALAAVRVARTTRTRAEAAARVAEARRDRAEAAAREAESRRRAAIAEARKAENLAERHELGAVTREVAIAHRHMVMAARRARRDAVRVARRADARADARRSEARNLASQVARAEAELEILREEAETARQARLRETKKMKRLAERAKAAEASLARAEKARREAEATHARARESLERAEVIRGEAETARKTAQAKLARAREARKLAEAKLAKARKLTAAAEAKAAAAEAKLAEAKADRKRRRKTAAVRDITFVDKDGISRVVIAMSRPTEAKVVNAEGTRVILDIADARIADRLERTLDTSEMNGSVVAISSYRHPDTPDKVRVVVDLARPVKQRLKKVGTTYYWDFADRKTKPEGEAVARKSDPDRSSKTGSKPTIVSPYRAAPRAAVYSQLSPMRNCRYRNRTIDIDLKDADLHNLMRLLADVGGLNIVIPGDVKATVTVRLGRVSWVKAMEVILSSKGLWYECEGNIIRIAPRKQLEAEQQAELDRLRSLAEAEAPETEVFTLNYAVAEELQPQLAPLLSPKGRLEIDDRTNSLIINDIAAHRRRIIQLVQRLDTQTPQIQIEARIVEARSTYSREIGIQWGGNFSADVSDGLVFDGAGGADDDQTNSTGVSAVPPNFGVNLPAAVGTGSGGALGLSLGALDGAFNINLRLSALEDQGTVRIVSAPKITVLNNVQAEISDGVSIPISVISANGVQTQFVPADLSLKVTPHVSQRDCSIAMNIEVTKNQPDFANTGARGDPTILRKEARTTILVNDGATAVIGGVYTRNTGVSYSKVPFFGDIPVLGWLFKSKVENDDRTEVLIFITPKITNRAFLRCEN